MKIVYTILGTTLVLIVLGVAMLPLELAVVAQLHKALQ